MTLSSHRLKASTSFFTVKAGWRPFLQGGVSANTPADSQWAPLRRAPPFTRLGVAMTTPWSRLDAGSGKELNWRIEGPDGPEAPTTA